MYKPGGKKLSDNEENIDDPDGGQRRMEDDNTRWSMFQRRNSGEQWKGSSHKDPGDPDPTSR